MSFLQTVIIGGTIGGIVAVAFWGGYIYGYKAAVDYCVRRLNDGR